MRWVRFYFAFSVLSVLLTFSTTAQECGIIFVSPNGASSGVTGTRANPASLNHGLSLANATNNVLWLTTGTYTITHTLTIPSDVTIEGGFDPTPWIKSNATASIIDRTSANTLPPPANALVGLAGMNASNFRLQDLTVAVADAPASSPANPFGISFYVIYLNACSTYNIVRCVFTTGTASDGQRGQNGANGPAG